MKIFTRDDSFSLLTLLLATTCLIVAFQYPADSSGFPRAVAAFLMLLAIGDLFRSVVGRRNSYPESSANEDDVVTGNWPHLRAALLVIASAPTYIVLARLFDFEIATFVYLAAGMLLLGVRNPLLIFSVSVGVLVAVKGLFFVLLDVTRTSTLIFGT
jgi:hypothetical protein